MRFGGPTKRLKALVGLLAVTAAAVPAAAQGATVTFLPNNGHTGGSPIAIALDDAGNIFTSNFYTGGVPGDITRITPAGTGSQFGGAIDDPTGVAVDSAGNVYVPSLSQNTVSRISPDGSMNTSPPWPVSVGDGPISIGIDANGNLYTPNANAGTVSRIAPGGGVTTAFGQAGSGPGTLAFDTAGNIYVTNNSSNNISRITPTGESTPNFAPTGDFPGRIAVDSGGNSYVVNFSSNNITKVSPDGSSTTPFASPGANPGGIAVDSAGNLFVAMSTAGKVVKITPSGTVSDLIPAGTIDGQPLGVVIDSSGNVFVTVTGGTGIHVNTVAKIVPNPGSPETAPAPPNRPAAPTATAGAQSASVSVPSNPTSARYGAPTSYAVAAAEDASKGCTVTPPATSCTVTGLTAGTSYTFTARARLNSWTTGPSLASGAVTPTGPKVSSVKSRVTRSGAYITSRVQVSGAGKLSQRATTGSKKLTTRCRTSRITSRAATYALKCNLGSRGRRALRRSSLKLTLRTTFTPTTGSAATTDRKVTLKRRR